MQTLEETELVITPSIERGNIHEATQECHENNHQDMEREQSFGTEDNQQGMEQAEDNQQGMEQAEDNQQGMGQDQGILTRGMVNEQSIITDTMVTEEIRWNEKEDAYDEQDQKEKEIDKEIEMEQSEPEDLIVLNGQRKSRRESSWMHDFVKGKKGKSKSER